MIDFLTGWPNPRLLPTELIAQATQRVLSDPDIFVPAFQYGPDPGHLPLRSAIASWLTAYQNHGKAINYERIAITGGASQNIGCILSTFTDPLYTRNVWLVSPTYYLSFQIFQDAGFEGRLKAVPEDEEGINIEYLRRQLRKSEVESTKEGTGGSAFKPPRPWAKLYRHIIYCVPNFSNPSSRTMTLHRRNELVCLAREYDALVITDDVYDFLQWPSKNGSGDQSLRHAMLPRLVDVDRFLDGGADRKGADGFGNVASNGSFSKISGPGLRTGWVEGSEKFAYGVSQTGTTKSGGAPSQYTSTLIADLLESGDLQKHIFEFLQPSYARRYRILMAAIEQHLVPLGVTLPQADRDVVGGYFLWLHLPHKLSGMQLATKAREEESLLVAHGEKFEVPGDTEGLKFPHHIRLSFAYAEEEKFDEGILRLARCIKAMLKSST